MAHTHWLRAAGFLGEGMSCPGGRVAAGKCSSPAVHRGKCSSPPTCTATGCYSSRCWGGGGTWSWGWGCTAAGRARSDTRGGCGREAGGREGEGEGGEGVQCGPVAPEDRPSTGNVVRMLEGEDHIAAPRNPFAHLAPYSAGSTPPWDTTTTGSDGSSALTAGSGT
ncbi:hypothetical protein ABZP36_004323 [Zizania latifolia]